MGIWDDYGERIAFEGTPRRDLYRERTKRYITRHVPANLSYKTVLLAGEQRNLVITDTDDKSIKNVMAMPGESLIHGGYVEWANSVWLITEVDAHAEVHEKGEMTRCNHILKWRDTDGNIIEKYSIVEDGTKYLIGEAQNDLMTIGASRMAVTVPKDSDTIKLQRGRRFLIDDKDSEEVVAYGVTKTNRLYNNYNGQGIFRYILKEEAITDNDNLELRVADYYEPDMRTNTDSYPDTDDGEGWL